MPIVICQANCSKRLPAVNLELNGTVRTLDVLKWTERRSKYLVENLLFSLVDSRLLTMEVIVRTLGVVGAFIAGILNYFTDMFLTTPLKASLKHLEEADLKTLNGGKILQKEHVLFFIY